MTENAKRDLRIAREWTPDKIGLWVEYEQEFCCHNDWEKPGDKDTTNYWPDLDDANNVDVIVEAKKISVEYLDYRKQWLAYSHTIRKEKEIADEPWSFSATGPTRQAAILALLDPGENKA